MDADLILLDETLARCHAKHIGLSITGTLGILIKAKQSGHIQELKPLINELRVQGIWISNRLMAEVLEIAGE
jgi:uncharacterized protein